MDRVKRTPTVTFRYELTNKVRLTSGLTPYSKLGQTLQQIHAFLTKEGSVLKTDHLLTKRLIYKFNSQLRHFKSFKYFKRINQYLHKIPIIMASLTEEVTILKDSYSQQGNAVFIPSRQMLEYVLVKIMWLGFWLRKVALFSVMTFTSCLVPINRAELTGPHVLFCSLASRVWIIARAVVLYLQDWYKDMYMWLPHLKGTQANCLNGFTLAGDLKEWLNQVCPVDDDPSLIEAKLPPEAHGVLSRFLADEKVCDSPPVLDLTASVEVKCDYGSEGRQSLGQDSDIGVAVVREKTAPKTRRTENQASVGCGDVKMKTSGKDRIKRKNVDSVNVDIGIPLKRRKSRPDEIEQPLGRTKSVQSRTGNAVKRGKFAADDVGEPVKRRRKDKNENEGMRDGNSKIKMEKFGDDSKKKKVKKDSKIDGNGCDTKNKKDKSRQLTRKGSHGQKGKNPDRELPKRKSGGNVEDVDESISKSKFNSDMKLMLKKPSKFMRELTDKTLSLDGKVMKISNKNRSKISNELAPILEQFQIQKSDAVLLSGSRKAKVLKDMKKSRLTFKKTAKSLLWKMVNKK